MLRVRWFKSGAKVKDNYITGYVESVTWEGSAEQVSRTATITMANNPYDKKMQCVLGLGDIIYLYEDKKRIFCGVITSRERSGEIGTVSYTAKDFMHYLIRSKGSYNFKNTKAETIAKKVCEDAQIGVSTKNLFKTGIKINKMLSEEVQLYNIIVGAYNMAARKMSSKYPPVFMPAMFGYQFGVIKKGMYCGVKLVDKADITSSSYSESTDNMVNQVLILNDNGKRVGIQKKTAWLNKYGLYQETYKKEEGVNPKVAAQQLLTGITKEATIEAVGNVACKAGYAVKIQDTATKLCGTFYIESDSHTWENGHHTMSLTLSFANEMEEV